jgi:AbrB family looped-hinge helix DNA binding protein
MSVTLKPKTEIIVPKSIRRKAGFKPGEQVEFKVSDRTITIVPKRTSEEREDYLEAHDPGVQEAISESNADIAAGRTKSAEELLRPLTRRKRTKTNKR